MITWIIQGFLSSSGSCGCLPGFTCSVSKWPCQEPAVTLWTGWELMLSLKNRNLSFPPVFWRVTFHRSKPSLVTQVSEQFERGNCEIVEKVLTICQKGEHGSRRHRCPSLFKKYLFGFCVLVFYFFCNDGMKLNDRHGQLSLRKIVLGQERQILKTYR